MFGMYDYSWFFHKVAVPSLIAGALVAPALHSDVPAAFARHPAPVPVASAPAHHDTEPPHDPLPEQAMPGQGVVTVITGAPGPAFPPGGRQYKSLTRFE